MNKKSLTIIIVLSVLALTGCGSAKGSLYKKSFVLKKVSEYIPSEKYKLDRIEPVKDADVSTEIYYFKSKERDLVFRAINTRTPAFYEANLYCKSINFKYPEDVHALYENDLNNVLTAGSYDFDHSRFYIRSLSDLSHVANVIVAADDIYKNELNFNTAKWLEEYPVLRCKVSLKEINSDGKEVSHDIGGIEINGSWDYKKLYDYLCFRYASCIMKGDFTDVTVPDSIMNMAHVTSLKHVYINDIEVSKTAYQATKTEGAYNNSESSYYADYCYKLGDYVIPFNTAVVPKECGPHATEEYLSLLAPGYEVEYKKGEYRWDYNGFTYKSFATTDEDDYVDTFHIYRDGVDLEIPFIKCGEWTSPVHGVYVVGLTVHDFADIFNLTVEIDEEKESIYFYEK